MVMMKECGFLCPSDGLCWQQECQRVRWFLALLAEGIPARQLVSFLMTSGMTARQMVSPEFAHRGGALKK